MSYRSDLLEAICHTILTDLPKALKRDSIYNIDVLI